MELKERWNMGRREKRDHRITAGSLGARRENSGRKHMNELSWVTSGECCNHVRKAYLSGSPPRGTWAQFTP